MSVLAAAPIGTSVAMRVRILNLQDQVVDAAFVRRVAARAARMHAHSFESVSIALVDDARIVALNRRHLGRERPTDVLAYPGDDEDPGYMGDVVISVETAARQALEADRPLLHEVAWLAAHGVLHLLGFDDAESASRVEMLALQDAALNDVLRTKRPKTP